MATLNEINSLNINVPKIFVSALKAKVEVAEKPSPKKAEKPVKEAPAPAEPKEENGAKKGRGRPPKAAAAKPAAKKAAPAKRAAPSGTGKGEHHETLIYNSQGADDYDSFSGRGRPPKAAKKQESADESADGDSDS